MNRRISDYTRRQLNLQRQVALKQGLLYEKKLIKLRTNEIKRVLSYIDQVPFKEIPTLPEMLEEAYLPKYYNDLYMTIGVPVAKETVNNFLSRKSADMWEDIIQDWVKKNAGKKITTIKATLKTWLKTQLEGAMADPKLGIETMTRDLYKRVMNEWEEAQVWQVRRIVQTEALTATSMAGFESVRALGVPFDKTWATSGNSNVRPAHQDAEGQTVDGDEPFIVNGEMMMYPRDDSMGASAGNIINCSCTHLARPKNL